MRDFDSVCTLENDIRRQTSYTPSRSSLFLPHFYPTFPSPTHTLMNAVIGEASIRRSLLDDSLKMSDFSPL